MPNRQQKLFEASNKLAKYYGLKTQQNLAAVVALEEIRTPGGTGRLSETTSSPNTSAANPNSAESKVIALIIDTSTGALTTKQILTQLQELTNNLSQEEIAELGLLLQIHYDQGGSPYGLAGNFAVTGDDGTQEQNGHITTSQQLVSVRQMLNNEEHPFVNASPNNPTKEQPGLSIILSNSTRVSPLIKFVNPVTIFLNGIPNIELSRATPYINLEFIVDRPPISNEGNRLNAISLPKFLLGAVDAGSSGILRGVVEANRINVTLSDEDVSGDTDATRQRAFTRGGVELFTAPQTMVNADEFEISNTVRANPILDKFRPFLSLKEVNIQIVPSTGIMSFKTATVQMVLHDRSRLHEVAEFIRPDFYSRNEITIEYGWVHPDGEREVNDNVYGDLINGMRVKEKFMIRNSNFSFDDAGQVIINLDLAMRGTSDFDTELISSNSDAIGDTIRQIRELEETIGELRERVYPEGTGARTREIRGVMVLDAASDARNHLTFTDEFRRELTTLRRSLRESSSRPDVTALQDVITRLYGDEIRSRTSGTSRDRRFLSGGEDSLVERLRTSIAEDITEKVRQLNATPEFDPFILPIPDSDSSVRRSARRIVRDATGAEERRRRRDFNAQQFGVTVEANNPCSLGKLLLYFIGEPLAGTQRYDDVQLIFYPFNIRAGRANRMNIANFLVDLEYFADEFARYRLNHIGRDGTMTLRQFMQFVQDTLIDDHAAVSYGISDLFETVVSADGTSLDTRARYEAPEYLQRLEQLLADVTPDGRFTMPVIDFYVEALPQNITIGQPEAPNDASDGKTILRIHIFDRVATSYESLGALLQSSRNSQITALGNGLREVPDNPTNSGVEISHRKQWQAALDEARQQGLIEYIVRTADGTTKSVDTLSRDVAIRFVAGSGQNLKQFLMNSMPYIIYGAGGTGIISANLASMQDSALSTVNMLRSFRRRGEVLPNGEQPGGLPMQIIPTQLSMETYGCPLISFAQQFFIDFQTGTTADNIYGVAALEHRIAPGEFKSNIRFVPLDAFGTYASLIGRINTAVSILEQATADSSEGSGTGAPRSGPDRRGESPGSRGTGR